MAMQLEKVVPFGRSLDEYRRLFALSNGDLQKNVISLADGPASFNAELTARGGSAISVDPLYVFSAADIEARFYAVVDRIIDQVKATPDDWIWHYHRSPDHLKENRCAALRNFVEDFDKGKTEGRYVTGELPHLKFPDGLFDLALCSHFLFLYSDHLTYEFHLASILEMLRVANEVRVFPLLTLGLEVSPYVAPLVSDLALEGFSASVETVPYEVQRGGHHMLRVRKGS